MSRTLVRCAGLLVAALLFAALPARAQSDAPAPSPEALTAAKELVATIHMTQQFTALMPSIMKTLKPAIVQNRADVERDYDALTPILISGFQARLGELAEAVAIIYASNFSADDLHALTAFYKTPVGQKLLEKTPVVTMQTMAAGQKFGQSVAAEMRQRMIDELRKKGHDL